jgi:hypothetical protein
MSMRTDARADPAVSGGPCEIAVSMRSASRLEASPTIGAR